MDSPLFFQDARREETDRVIVCRVSQLHQVGLMVGTVENVVHGRRPMVDKPEILFFEDLCLRFSTGYGSPLISGQEPRLNKRTITAAISIFFIVTSCLVTFIFLISTFNTTQKQPVFLISQGNGEYFDKLVVVG